MNTQRSMRRVYARVATLIALPLALIALIPSMVGLVAQQHHTARLEQEVRDRCEEGRVNRNAIRSTITDGLPALGYRHDPETGRVVRTGRPIDYYATHPAERQAALARAVAALQRFPAIDCT